MRVRYQFFLLLLFNVSKCDDDCLVHLSLSRTTQNEGMHRDIQYDFQLFTNGAWNDCLICAKEILPSGLYANNDQLEDLRRLSKLSTYVNGTIDVESPESESQPNELLIFAELTTFSNFLHGNTSIPIHTRYHAAQSGGGYKKAILRPPEIFMKCSIYPIDCQSDFVEMYCDFEGTKLCKFLPISYNSSSDLIFDIPVGDTNLYPLVQTVTILVTTLGSLYLCYVVIEKQC